MSIQTKGGKAVEDPRLGRVAPEDWKHVEKYPLRGLPTAERPSAVPVAMGVNWYRKFYAEHLIERVNKGRKEFWVPEGDLGPLEGGHAISAEPFHGKFRDALSWWLWHDQVSEGICVSECCVRVMAMLNRKRYQPRPIYDHAQTIDEWPGEGYSGTSVNAGLATLRTLGAVPAKKGERHFIGRGEIDRPFVVEEGIAANRWARDDADIFRTLGNENAEYVIWLNSWGKDYPRRVKVPRSVISRLHQEDGEMGIITDR